MEENNEENVNRTYRCLLCGRKLKKYSETGYGKVCLKKVISEKYKQISLFDLPQATK